jgi:tetratricopeptide (TPR) repeat protein
MRLLVSRPAISGLPLQASTRDFKAFSDWVGGTKKFHRLVFLGALFEHVGERDEAEGCYKRALGISPSSQSSLRAKRRLADLAYRSGTQGEQQSLSLYQDCLDLATDPIDIADVKVCISNVYRRRGEAGFVETYRLAKEAFDAYEALPDEKRSKVVLDYARCLNVYGLACYSKGRKDPELLKEAWALAERSRGLKEDSGDPDGVAESENLLALIRTEESKHATGPAKTQLLVEAMRFAEEALNKRLRIGRFDKCFAPVRNLAYPQSELMRLAASDQERQEWFVKAERNYKQALEALQHVTPHPPVGEVCHLRTILAEFYLDYADRVSDKSDGRCRAEGLRIVTELWKDSDAREEICRVKLLVDRVNRLTSRLRSIVGREEDLAVIDNIQSTLG